MSGQDEQDCGGTVVMQGARHSAYAELIAGLLDVRDTTCEAEFDAALAAAERDHRIDADTARLLRWWQRESVRAIVDHAQSVLPATLMALEASVRDGRERIFNPSSDALVDDPTEEAGGEAEWEEQPLPPTDLSARRLLVAGLTPLRDP
ncbi:MAG: hypothetical protein ABI586_08600 [Candidatus Nanopelagicales bacterium]